MTSLTKLMPQWQQRVENALEQWLPLPSRFPFRLHEAMRYSTLDGGKRIRPLLMYATATATGQNLSELDGPACAIELIHAYSLIHDDLPCMDDDDLRRGKPTCHKAYDEAMAVLAGDALQALAFQILSSDPAMTDNAAVRLEMMNTLSRAAGSKGMAGGQAVDLAAVGTQLPIAELEAMHIYKTGALIRASVRIATLNAVGLDADIVKHLDHYSKCVGLAFQIRDDILDVVGDTETLGKQAGADSQLEKPTFPGAIGLQASKQRARDLHEEALESLKPLPKNGKLLRQIADFIVDRIH